MGLQVFTTRWIQDECRTVIIPKCPGKVEFGLEKSIKVGRPNHRTEQATKDDSSTVASVAGDCGDQQVVGAFCELCCGDEDCAGIEGGEVYEGVFFGIHLGDGRASVYRCKKRGEEFRGIGSGPVEMMRIGGLVGQSEDMIEGPGPGHSLVFARR